MNSNVSVELWLHPDKLSALQAALEREHSTLRDHLQSSLEELYRIWVPHEPRAELREKLREEFLQQEFPPGSNFCWAAYRIMEGGELCCCKTRQADELLDAARRLMQYLGCPEEVRPQRFADTIPQRLEITPDDFDQFDLLRTETTGQISGVFDIHLDQGLFSAVNIHSGWHSYRVGDVYGAACYAFQNGSLSTSECWARLLERLCGRELTPDTNAMKLQGDKPLPVEQLRFADELPEYNGRLNFYVPVNFDPDEVFGTHVATAENDDFLNVYAQYDLDSGLVCDELTVVLVRGDATEEEYHYPLTQAQRQVLREKMDAYCQAQTGLYLEDFRAHCLSEMQGPAAPQL